MEKMLRSVAKEQTFANIQYCSGETVGTLA